MQLSAVILAGGQSRRMGRDKAWIELEGQPLLLRALSTVRDAGITEIFISGRADTDYSALNYPVLLDREPGAGPLAGIEQALAASAAPLTLVLAVDLPHMTAAFLQALAQGCSADTGAVPEITTAQVVGLSVPERRAGSIGPNDVGLIAHDGGPGRTALPKPLPGLNRQLEPLAAIYPRRCQTLANDCLRQGRRAARHFAELCRAAGAVHTFPVATQHLRCFENWNTPQDLWLPESEPSPPNCHPRPQCQPTPPSPKFSSCPPLPAAL